VVLAGKIALVLVADKIASTQMWRSNGRAMCKQLLHSINSRTIRIIVAATRSHKATALVRLQEAAVPFHFLGEAPTIEAVILASLDRAEDNERHPLPMPLVVPALVASATQPVPVQLAVPSVTPRHLLPWVVPPAADGKLHHLLEVAMAHGLRLLLPRSRHLETMVEWQPCSAVVLLLQSQSLDTAPQAAGTTAVEWHRYLVEVLHQQIRSPDMVA